MQLHELRHPYKRKAKKRIGRGGKRGTYSGKGQKGQRSRTGHRIRPAERDMLSRLPKLRGIKHPSLFPKPLPINLDTLERKMKSLTVSPRTLCEAGIIRSEKIRVKIVSDGEVKRAFSVLRIPVSKTAKAKIEKAGGKVA